MYLLPLAKSMNVVTVIRLISRKGMLVWVTVITLVKSYHPLKKSPKVWGVQRKREKDRTFPQRVGLEWGIKTRWLILPWVHPRSRVNLRFSIMGAWFGQGPCYVKKDETFPLVFPDLFFPDLKWPWRTSIYSLKKLMCTYGLHLHQLATHKFP